MIHERRGLGQVGVVRGLDEGIDFVVILDARSGLHATGNI